VLALGDQAVYDFAHLRGLALSLLANASRLWLQVVHQDMDNRAAWCSDLFLRAVPAENHANHVCRVHIVPDGFNLEVCSHHDPHVDAPFVVPIDELDVLIQSAQQFLVEPYGGCLSACRPWVSLQNEIRPKCDVCGRRTRSDQEKIA
jgi:hypothetical protein